MIICTAAVNVWVVKRRKMMISVRTDVEYVKVWIVVAQQDEVALKILKK